MLLTRRRLVQRRDILAVMEGVEVMDVVEASTVRKNLALDPKSSMGMGMGMDMDMDMDTGMEVTMVLAVTGEDLVVSGGAVVEAGAEGEGMRKLLPKRQT